MFSWRIVMIKTLETQKLTVPHDVGTRALNSVLHTGSAPINTGWMNG